MSAGAWLGKVPKKKGFEVNIDHCFSPALQVKTTNPKKYCVRPNTGIVLPRATCDVTGTP